ncbi:hypothetical protein G5V57_18280 [Nordella sp. HKS 07]|uniref:hypothetical protein n=1 Tax=Nordella sp. HKS 07 TaxID=2712222 RepID=UPI0013E1A49A|nr:hypothetical protein [Nordella sp. HKS 07]QIG49485.1 hypothetical protein G5V57_18280 [Nordella sp. HKS 07]
MDLVPEQIIRRRDLHDQLSGQSQGGISTPADHPIILLFTGRRLKRQQMTRLKKVE